MYSTFFLQWFRLATYPITVNSKWYVWGMRVLWISKDYFGTLAHGDQIHLSNVGNILGIQRGACCHRKRCMTYSDPMTFYGMKYSDFTKTCFQSPWNSNRRWDPILVQVETNHRNIWTNHQSKVSYLASWTTGSLPHVLIHFCRAPVQRRAKSHSHPFGKQTNKNPHKPRKKNYFPKRKQNH